MADAPWALMGVDEHIAGGRRKRDAAKLHVRGRASPALLEIAMPDQEFRFAVAPMMYCMDRAEKQSVISS
jgi:hypothetical protein